MNPDLTLPVLEQLHLQLLYLPAQRGDGPRALVLVDGDLVLDVPGPIRIFEGAEGLHEVAVAGRDAGYHDGLAVAAERVLQQPRQLRVAVRHVQGLLRLVAQGRDHVAQRQLQRDAKDVEARMRGEGQFNEGNAGRPLGR